MNNLKFYRIIDNKKVNIRHNTPQMRIIHPQCSFVLLNVRNIAYEILHNKVYIGQLSYIDFILTL